MNKKELLKRMAPERPLPADVAKEKEKALTQVGPLQTRYNGIKVKDEASCQEMDILLGDVVQARKGWGSIWARIHEKSIKPFMDGINNLHEVNRLIDGPLDTLETLAKKDIKAFRIADQRRIEAARVEQDKLARQAEEIQERIDNARTLAQRGKLLEKKEVIDTKVVAAFEATAAVMTENSGHREKPAWRLVGSEVEGLYPEGDTPPSFLVVLESILAGHIPPQAVCLNLKYINETFKGAPEVVASWPGFEIFYDIQIVRR